MREAEEQRGDDRRRLQVVVCERAVLEPRVDALKRLHLDRDIGPGRLQDLGQERKDLLHRVRQVHAEPVALRPLDTQLLDRHLLRHLCEGAQCAARQFHVAEGCDNVGDRVGPLSSAVHVDGKGSDAGAEEADRLPVSVTIATTTGNVAKPVEFEYGTEYHLAEFGRSAVGQLRVVPLDFFVEDVDEEQYYLGVECAEVALQNFSTDLP